MTGAVRWADVQSPDTPSCRPVVVWLYALAVLIFAMVLVGGATRLTDSGLSITEWKPLLGAIPPLNGAAWLEAFDKYKQIPEYQIINRGMSLSEFKFIYWWEWTHRFLGRIIGFAFLLPFAVFMVSGRIRLAETPKFIALFALGGLQGFLGWYMVQSGLAERVDVSQYRLAAHLGLAIALLAAILWVALNWDRKGLRKTAVLAEGRAAATMPWGVISKSAAGLTAAIYLQFIFGGFVAGLDAGKAHNTWPLMDGELIPSSLGAITPWWRDIFENITTVQFNHRLMAYAIVVWGLLQMAAVWRGAAPRELKRSTAWIGLAVFAQAALGVWTVIEAAPLWLGLAHQGGAVILLALALLHLHKARQFGV